jgi:A/G-specific adenine glycosylase
MPSHLHPWPDERIRSFRRALLEFFQQRQRDLPWRDAPWRDTPTPYGTLVSEIMLQQTRVETVVPYYLRWMERFPDPETLAAADEEEVLRMWQGLGYYSRARNLLKAVREVVNVHGGEVPRDRAKLEGLPGVGPYTSGAVASIAFGEPEPAVDGNVRRVLARLMDEPAPTPGTLEAWARGLVDPHRPGDFNQALMELGAMVCTPRSPSCRSCPVSSHCEALAQRTVEERPTPKTRRATPRLVEAVAVVVRMPTGERTGPEVLLLRRPATGLLARMWGCPGREVTDDADPAGVARELARELLAGGFARGTDDGGSAAGEPAREKRADSPAAPTELPSVEHVFSHRKVTYRPYRFLVEESSVLLGDAPLGDGSKLRWVSFDELGGLPLPVAQLRILSAARGADQDAPP